MVAKQVKIHHNEKKIEWSDDKPGSAKKHPWFYNFDWEALEKGKMQSPFIGIVNLI
jgi:hypothetical protein